MSTDLKWFVPQQGIKDSPLRRSECITAQGLKNITCMTAFPLHCRRVVVTEENEEMNEEEVLRWGRLWDRAVWGRRLVLQKSLQKINKDRYSVVVFKALNVLQKGPSLTMDFKWFIPQSI